MWVLSALCELFKVKNPYKEEYDAEMERYTAHKPEYYMNNDEPDEPPKLQSEVVGNGSRKELQKKLQMTRLRKS